MSQKVALSEGETQNISLNGYSFVASREADLSDYKDLRLKVEASG